MLGETNKEFGKGKRPDQLLGPPVPSPFTDVLYSAERGVAQGAKLRMSSLGVNIGKTPGDDSLLQRTARAHERSSKKNSRRTSRWHRSATLESMSILLLDQHRDARRDRLRAVLDAAIDHVSIAVRDIGTAIPFYVETLGASFLFAGERRDQGFRWAQFTFPGGGKIELVTPLGSDGFVWRFLERRGEGPHHVTLKVPDIERAITHLEGRGVPLFSVSTARTDWKEAFIHPRDANGTLIQIAQSSFSDEEVARHHLQPHDPGTHRHLSLADLRGEPSDKTADPAIS
ncbi:MAG: VOC family protein [Actinomycetota bacterium]